MSSPDAAMVQEYLAILRRSFEGGEDALTDAYEFGRRAFEGALGLMEIVAVHHEALAQLLGEATAPVERVLTTRGAAQVESESLSVFEMALRGYREVIAELSRSNEQLRELAIEQRVAAKAEREAREALEETHRELKSAQGQLVQSARLAALGQLVAGVAHEINNPLAFIVNNIAVLRRDAQAMREMLELYRDEDAMLERHSPERHARIRELAERVDMPYVLGHIEELTSRARDGLRRIQQIVQDLRSFARIDSADAIEESDLAGGIASTLNIVRGEARDRGVELESELAPIPTMLCSPGKLHQVVLNLVTNALDACDAGDRVTVRSRATDDEAIIEVSDTGSGMDASVRERIFDPFFTTKPPGKGTGLGLSISHGIVAAHGGRIEVRTASGEGSLFTVRLPLRRPSPSVAKPAPMANGDA